MGEDIPTEVAAIHDPFGNAVHTALADTITGKTVLITGCGPIGVAAAAIAKKAGATRVYASFLNDYRLDLALKLGADRVFKVGRDDVVARILEETEGLGVDVLLEMAGTAPAINEGFRALRAGGWAALLGLPSNRWKLTWPTGFSWRRQGIRHQWRRMYETWHRCRPCSGQG